jgi:WD40 repeat protein
VTAAPAVRDTGVVDRNNPWPGLAAFRERDQEFFYGRESPVQVLLDLVSRERVSVLYGASGLGKTSLIQAGLFPRARARDLFPVRIRLDYSRPDTLHEQIFAALLKDASEHRVEAPTRGTGTIWEFFYRKDSLWWSDRHRLLTPLLVFDQFEETFTVGRRSPEAIAATRAFLLDLRGLALGFPPDAVKARVDANPDEALRYSLARSPIRFLFSFREDYLAEFVELREVFPGIGQNDFRLLPMSTADGLRVILSPGGHLVSEDVAKEIVTIIAGQRPTRRRLENELPVDPTLLSVFCRELNNERVTLNEPRISDELLKDRQVTILDNFYTRSVEGLDPGVQTFVEDDLILPDSPERNFVAEEVALRKPGVTAPAIEELINRRLLRRDERDGPARLELTHDVLIDPVRRSRDARRAREQQAQRLAAAREEAERGQQAAEQVFERQRRQRLRVFVAVLSVLLLAATALAAWAFRASGEAKRAKAARTLTESSIQSVDGNHPEMALAYIAYAARTDPKDARTRERLIDALLHRWWPLPLAVMKQPAGVRWAEFDRTSTSVLTVSEDGGVTVWPASDAGASRRLSTNASFARFAPTGHVLVATKGNAIELWDAASGRRVAAFTAPDAAITAAAASPDAAFLAVGDAKGHLHVWRLSAPDQPPLTKTAHPEAISIVQFSDNSRRLLTTSAGNASVWDVPSFTVATVATQLAAFLSADFAPDSEHLVLTDEAGKGRLWRFDEGVSGGRGKRRGPAALAPYAEFQPNGRVFFTQFSPDGQFVVTASEDGTAQIWNTVAGDLFGVPMKHGGAVLTAVFSPDGSRILTASRDGSARLWDAAGGQLAEPMWHLRPLASATFSRDGDRVVTACDDGTAEVWDVRPGAAAPESWGQGTLVSSAQFSPDDRYVLITDDDAYNPSETFANVWDRREGRTSLRTPHDAVAPPQFLPGGDTILVVRRNTAVIVRAAGGTTVGAPMPGAHKVLIARASADGSRIAVLRADGGVQIYDANGAAVTRLQTPVGQEEQQPPSLEFSRDGRLVAVPAAVAALDSATLSPQANQTGLGRVRVWDLSHPEAAPREFRAPSPIESVTFSPDAKWLLATGTADAAYIFSIDDRSATAPAPVPLYHNRRIVSSRFNAQGTAIVTTSEDATARLWKQPWRSWTSLVLRHDAPVGTATVATPAVLSGSFNPNGDRVVTSSENGVARVWDVATGERSASFQHPAVVRSAEFSSDGDHILTACADGRARIWDLPIGSAADVGELAEIAEGVAGYRLNDDAELTRLDAHVQTLQALRDALSRRPTQTTLSGRIASWFFADRWKRTISPFSQMTVSRFVDDQLATGSRDEVQRLYPGHPALRPGAGHGATTGDKQ